jgi:hypothetical protein
MLLLVLLCLVEHCCCGAAQLLSECLLQDVWGPIPHLASSHITLAPHSQPASSLGSRDSATKFMIYFCSFIYLLIYIFLGISLIRDCNFMRRGCRFSLSMLLNEKKGVGKIFKFGTYLEVEALRVRYAAPSPQLCHTQKLSTPILQ